MTRSIRWLSILLVVLCAVVTMAPPSDVLAQRRGRRCPEGQERNADTAGQCCYPGQVWSSARAACVGSPTACPPSFVASGETCACAPGTAATPETRGHCCWGGQLWSTTRAACVGAPTSCPDGTIAIGETCVAPPACSAGMAATTASGGHCCWPGQSWDALRQTCAGAPSCPPTHFASGETCEPLATCDGGRVASAATMGQCCWPGQSWSSSACAGAPTACPEGWIVRGSECVPGVAAAFATVQRLVHGLRYALPADGIHGMYLLETGPGCTVQIQDDMEGPGPDPIRVTSHTGIDMSRVTAAAASQGASGSGASAMGPAWRESSVEPERRPTPALSFIADLPVATQIARALHALAVACGASPTLEL